MRLWTLHPRYLDPKGLVAGWREALLAQKVLQGKTRGYHHHPQLIRFQAQSDPLAAIATFLAALAEEAGKRGYHFDASKIIDRRCNHLIPETQGQLLFEWQHLQTKLAARAPHLTATFPHTFIPDPHPLFQIIPGKIQPWEKV